MFKNFTFYYLQIKVFLPTIIYRCIWLLEKNVNTIVQTYKTNKLGSDYLHYKIICFTKWYQFKLKAP